MKDGQKAVWSILYVFVAFFTSVKRNFIAYRFSKVSSHPYCICEIHQIWQSGFSRVYSNCCCSCSFEPEIFEISQLSQMYSNNILNFQVYDNFKCMQKISGILLNAPHTYTHTHVYIYIYRCVCVCVCVCHYVCCVAYMCCVWSTLQHFNNKATNQL